MPKKAWIDKFDKLLLDLTVSKTKMFKKHKINRSRVVMLTKEGRVSPGYQARLLTALLSMQTILDRGIEDLSKKV